MIYNSNNIKWMDFGFFQGWTSKIIRDLVLVRKSNNESKIEKFLIHI